MKLWGTKDIKFFVERVLNSKKDELSGKIVIDLPAGSGHSTRILHQLGARVEAYDLFPEYFKVEGLQCREADLTGEVPVADGYADTVLCQEGVEHLPDQLRMFREFNRMLKPGGTLLLTTPNYSMLRARLSYFLSESEYACKIMPPNELDSVWFSDRNRSDIYFGHIFLIGIQKLRILARTAGFRIKKIHHLRINHTSLILLVFFYPFILAVNLLAYARAMRKNTEVEVGRRKKVYGEILKLGIDPRILTGGHLFVEFEKECQLADAGSILQSKYKDFNIVT